MSKDRLRQAAVDQVDRTAREIPEEHRERPKGRRKKEDRLVIRLDVDQLRRLEAHCRALDLPVSTWARSTLLNELRKA